MDVRDPPTEWEDEDWLFVMMALQDFAEQPVESGDRIGDVMEMSTDGYSVRAIQLRDGIADYLGIQPGEAEEQLRGGSGEQYWICELATVLLTAEVALTTPLEPHLLDIVTDTTAAWTLFSGPFLY